MIGECRKQDAGEDRHWPLEPGASIIDKNCVFVAYFGEADDHSRHQRGFREERHPGYLRHGFESGVLTQTPRLTQAATSQWVRRL
jgi:hypothetical protein